MIDDNPGELVSETGNQKKNVQAEHVCDSFEACRNNITHAIVTALTKDRETQRTEELINRMKAHEEQRSSKIDELEQIPLENLKGYQRNIAQTYRDLILYATSAAYKLPYDCVRTRTFLRVKPDLPGIERLGSEDLAPNVTLDVGRRGLVLFIQGFDPVNIAYVNVQGKHYIELGQSEAECLATSAFLAVTSTQYESFYDSLVEWVSRLFPFKPGEVSLSGYDDVVEYCNKILRCSDPRLMKRHILLSGPPGCGKSMIAKRIVIDNPDYVCFYLSKTGNGLKWFEFFSKVLQKCRRKMLLVIDEIDELGLSRGEDHSHVYELLRLMDGAADLRNLTILATTNRPQVLDEALLRPGRFGRGIRVGVPNPAQVREIVEFYNLRLGSSINPEVVIRSSEKMPSGADIRLAMEDCIIREEPINDDNVVRNLELMNRVEADRSSSGKKAEFGGAGYID